MVLINQKRKMAAVRKGKLEHEESSSCFHSDLAGLATLHSCILLKLQIHDIFHLTVSV